MVDQSSTEFKNYFVIRIIIAALFIGLLIVLLIGRTIKLQVYDFQFYKTKSQNNHIQVLPIIPLRGQIFDRNLNTIAGHVIKYDLIYYPNKTKIAKARIINMLEYLIELTQQEKKLIEQKISSQKNQSIVIREQIDHQDIANINSLSFLPSGLEVKTRINRFYPLKESLATVSGYVGKISLADEKRIAAKFLESKYRGLDIIGKIGLERSYEDSLRGTPGYKKVEKSAIGRVIRTIDENPPTPGSDLITSIDSEFQAKIHKMMDDKNGAVVALNPKNGEILALVSNQSYDPNIFIEENKRQILDIFKDPDKPMLNRAIAGLYPPASTFKPFVGLAGLEYQKRSLDEEYICYVYYSLPGSSHKYRDWNKGGHGKVDFHRSIVRSVDTYYYSLAFDTGIENLNNFINNFNFGRTTGIDIVGEQPGLLPSAQWKKKRFGRDWLPGDTVSVGIGQGYMLSTPLQLAVAYSTIANKGYAYRPRLVKAIRNPLTGKIQPTTKEKIVDIKINPENINAVYNALTDVTRDDGTSARSFRDASYQSAGKTGTAQVISIAQDQVYQKKTLKTRYHDHALYVGFAPVEDPQIVVSIILENAGGGSRNAAPIVRKVFDEYLNRKS